jgi:2,3-diketo-5-methylthio-1-phosphopentane phosphatase
VKVFVDCDGTIVREDVGNSFFRRFGGERAAQAVALYRSGAIDARECYREEAAAVGRVTRDQVEAFADTFTLDPAFAPFVSFCDTLKAPVTVLSDGLDVYVRRLLERNGLSRLAWYANEAVFTDEGLEVRFPHADETCPTCANCKRNHVAMLSADDDVVVYAGDGISDRCAVGVSDIVFARGSLVAYCQEKNITYHTFRSFTEIRSRLASLIASGGLRQRREAAMARRALFVAG